MKTTLVRSLTLTLLITSAISIAVGQLATGHSQWVDFTAMPERSTIFLFSNGVVVQSGHSTNCRVKGKGTYAVSQNEMIAEMPGLEVLCKDEDGYEVSTKRVARQYRLRRWDSNPTQMVLIAVTENGIDITKRERMQNIRFDSMPLEEDDRNKLVELWIDKADKLLREGNKVAAIKSYDVAIEIAPKNDRAYRAKAGSLGRAKEYKLAIDTWSQALVFETKEPSLYFYRGEMY